MRRSIIEQLLDIAAKASKSSASRFAASMRSQLSRTRRCSLDSQTRGAAVSTRRTKACNSRGGSRAASDAPKARAKALRSDNVTSWFSDAPITAQEFAALPIHLLEETNGASFLLKYSGQQVPRVQFTCVAFLDVLRARGHPDQHGRRVPDGATTSSPRFWRSVRFEEVYVHAYATGLGGAGGTRTTIQMRLQLSPERSRDVSSVSPNCLKLSPIPEIWISFLRYTSSTSS